MAQVHVVADDLTGANATGGLFADSGFTTASLREHSRAPEVVGRFEVVCVSTGSRHLDLDDARGRVVAAFGAVGEVALRVKRIDTTLRGNVGAEIDAALDASRPSARAVVVPAFPAAGRTTVDGVQLLDGVPLAETAAARDPLAPVSSSRVADIVAAQSGRSIGEVTQAAASDPAALERALAGDEEIVVCDALDDHDLSRIAGAAAAVARTGNVTWISVDPGPFGPHLAAALGLSGTSARPPVRPSEPASGPLLMVSGSATDRTLEQLAHVSASHDARFVDLDVTDLAPAQAAARLAALVRDAAPGAVVGVRSAARDSDVARIDGSHARRILDCLAGAVRSVLDSHRIAGLYLTGGDVTDAVLEVLGAHGVAVLEQVMPLAVAGRILGGPYEGLAVVTKGGLVGDRAAAAVCVDRLRAHSVGEEDGPHDREGAER